MDWAALIKNYFFHCVVEKEDYEYDYKRECEEEVADVFVLHQITCKNEFLI